MSASVFSRTVSKISTLIQRTSVMALMTGMWITNASAQSVCVFDPGGKAGDYYHLLEQYALEASSWGVSLEVKVYTDGETAVMDYEAASVMPWWLRGAFATVQRFQQRLKPSVLYQPYPLLKSMVRDTDDLKGCSQDDEQFR